MILYRFDSLADVFKVKKKVFFPVVHSKGCIFIDDHVKNILCPVFLMTPGN